MTLTARQRAYLIGIGLLDVVVVGWNLFVAVTGTNTGMRVANFVCAVVLALVAGWCLPYTARSYRRLNAAKARAAEWDADRLPEEAIHHTILAERHQDKR